MRTLHDLGLIELTATRQRRGATEHVYQALETPRFSDDAWEGLAPVAKRRLLTAMLRQTGEYVNGSAAGGGFDRTGANVSRLPLRLDERGWKQMARATKKWLAEVDRIQGQVDERVARDGAGDVVEAGLVLLFERVALSDQGPTRDGGRHADGGHDGIRSRFSGTPVS